MALTKVTSGLISADASSVDLNIDAGTLYIDATNNRVGIGTTSPNAALDILGATSDQLRLRTAETEEYKIGRNSTTGYLEFDGTQTGYIGYIFKNGNVGIGTSSPATKLHVEDSSGNVYIQAKRATQSQGQVAIALAGGTGGTDWIFYQDTSSDNLNIFGNSGNRMTITSSGNVGIGTSSPSQKVDVVGNIRAANSGADTKVEMAAPSDSYSPYIAWNVVGIRNSGALGYPAGSDDLVYRSGGYTMTTGTERIRFHSNGSVSIGSPTNIGTLGIVQNGATSTTFSLYDSSSNRRWFYLPNGYYGYQGVEQIYANGGVNRYFDNATGTVVGSIVVNSGSVAFNTTSDYRLKDNPQPLTGSGEFIDALQPKTWTWNHSDGGTGIGFIAHEVAEVGLGLCVSGEKDGVRLDVVLNEQTGEYEEQEVPKYQQVDYSNSELIANMVAELQSLRARVAELENA